MEKITEGIQKLQLIIEIVVKISLIFCRQVGTICNFREMVARCLGPFNSKIKYKVYYNIGVQNPTYVFLIMYVKSYLASSTEHLSEK